NATRDRLLTNEWPEYKPDQATKIKQFKREIGPVTICLLNLGEHPRAHVGQKSCRAGACLRFCDDTSYSFILKTKQERVDNLLRGRKFLPALVATGGRIVRGGSLFFKLRENGGKIAHDFRFGHPINTSGIKHHGRIKNKISF